MARLLAASAVLAAGQAGVALGTESRSIVKGQGSDSFFNKGVDIFAANAFEVPASLPPGSMHDLLTIFLDPATGRGGISNVINNTGGSSTIANPDAPVTVVSFP